MSHATPRTWMTVAEVADHIRCAEKSIRRWMAERGLPHYRIGGKLLFRTTEVDAWVRRHRNRPCST